MPRQKLARRRLVASCQDQSYFPKPQIEDLGAICSPWFIADLIESLGCRNQPRSAIQDPVTWAILISTNEDLRHGPMTLGSIRLLNSRSIDALEKSVPTAGQRRSCLELIRFAGFRNRVREMARLAWQLAGRINGVDKEALWNATVFSSLGWVLLLNSESDMASSIAREYSNSPSAGDQEHMFQTAARFARDFCLKLELPDWCLSWTTRMAWPTTLSLIPVNQKKEWHAARIASFLEARGRPSLNGTQQRGFLESCKELNLDPQGHWKDGLPELAATACPDPETPSGDFPEADHRWFRISMAQAKARSCDQTLRLSDNLRLERELAVRSMESMYEDISRLTSERIMEGMAEFTAGAGHEINNPLAIIQGKARQIQRRVETLAKKSAVEELRSSLEEIQEQCRRLHALLKKLMRFARPGPARMAAVSAGSLVSKLEEIAQGIVTGSNLECSTSSKLESMLIATDLTFLGDAWAEICRNAAWSSGDSGIIAMRVDTSHDSERLLIRLINNGPAIPRDARQHLFTPFFSSRPAGRGAGLGLPLAWKLCESVGAKLILESDGEVQPVCWLLEIPIMLSDSPHSAMGSISPRNAA